jgi:peroxiredoxin
MNITKLGFTFLMATAIVTLSFFMPVSAFTVGDTVADFNLRNIDGNMVSMSSYKANAKGYIVIFTCNHCPYSKAYEDRLVALDKKYAALGYALIAINPTDAKANEEDSFDNMKLKAKEKGYTFPYLTDESQEVTKAFGATKTPYSVVVKKEGDKFVVQYAGAIDDNPQDATGVSKKYVEDAVNNLITGKPVMVTSVRSIGCAIKFKN